MFQYIFSSPAHLIKEIRWVGTHANITVTMPISTTLPTVVFGTALLNQEVPALFLTAAPASDIGGFAIFQFYPPRNTTINSGMVYKPTLPFVSQERAAGYVSYQRLDCRLGLYL